MKRTLTESEKILQEAKRRGEERQQRLSEWKEVDEYIQLLKRAFDDVSLNLKGTIAGSDFDEAERQMLELAGIGRELFWDWHDLDDDHFRESLIYEFMNTLLMSAISRKYQAGQIAKELKTAAGQWDSQRLADAMNNVMRALFTPWNDAVLDKWALLPYTPPLSQTLLAKILRDAGVPKTSRSNIDNKVKDGRWDRVKTGKNGFRVRSLDVKEQLTILKAVRAFLDTCDDGTPPR